MCDFGISGRLVDSKAKTRSAGCAAYMAVSVVFVTEYFESFWNSPGRTKTNFIRCFMFYVFVSA